VSPMTSLAANHSLAAEQAAPGRNLAGCRTVHRLSCPALTWVDVEDSAILLLASLSSVSRTLSISRILMEVVSIFSSVSIGLERIKSSLNSARNGILRRMQARSASLMAGVAAAGSGSPRLLATSSWNSPLAAVKLEAMPSSSRAVGPPVLGIQN
jgi:hypothetical protein